MPELYSTRFASVMNDDYQKSTSVGEITQLETREMQVILMKLNDLETPTGLELQHFMRLMCLKYLHFDQCFVTYACVLEQVTSPNCPESLWDLLCISSELAAASLEIVLVTFPII